MLYNVIRSNITFELHLVIVMPKNALNEIVTGRCKRPSWKTINDSQDQEH